MPEGPPAKGRTEFKRFLTGVVVGVVLAGIGVAIALAVHSGGTTKPTPSAQAAPGIDMSTATGFACGTPLAPGPGHPDTVLSQVFNVHDRSGTAYVLGWQIVPFRGTGHSYRFGAPGNLLALQPSTGGPPLGYGKGTLTFRTGAESGTVDAVVTLKSGKPLTVRGSWNCVATPNPLATTTTTTPAPLS